MSQEEYDAIVVGAGFSGVYQLIHLRQLGLRCTVIEAGSDFGGTWHWNRYPGARVDSHVPVYELALPELWRDWTWAEKFPGWKELQAYFKYVAEKMDLRPYCRFDTTVKRAHWDDESHIWRVAAEGKEGLYEASARYLILCTGSTSKPYIPDITGRDTFKGPWCHTSRWPKEGIETAGKRVGVVGTGASGIQLIQKIGAQVAHLTVFQRTPNMALPMGQYDMSKQVQEHFKPVYEELYKKLHTTVSGFLYEPISRLLSTVSDEEREATFERLWDLGGFNFPLGNYEDVLSDKASNNVAYEFWRRKVSERVKDPVKRDLLAPAVAPHPMGSKRQSLEQNFYEILDRHNVDLVDVKKTPILEIHESGVKTSAQEHQLDVIVFATGFDGYVGAFNDIDLRGLNGKSIQDHWRDGVTTYLGMTIDSFPNLFFMHGPHGPTALCNGPTCLQIQGAWIVQTITYLRENHITKFTPTTRAAVEFKRRIEETCAGTSFQEVDSWYMGANVPGKKREAYNYVAGAKAYKQEIMAEIERGYPGFFGRRSD